MLAFIPILGPIIQGAFGLIGKGMDLKLQGIKDNSERIRLQHELTMSSTSKANADLLRDIVCFPTCLWSAFIVWDSIVAKSWPFLMLHPVELPGHIAWLPYAVLAYLLGNAWINRK